MQGKRRSIPARPAGGVVALTFGSFRQEKNLARLAMKAKQLFVL